MAFFKVKKLYSTTNVVIGHEIYSRKWWQPWNKSVRTNYLEVVHRGYATIVVGDKVICEISGKIRNDSWTFEADAPEGIPYAICGIDTHCEIERMS